MPESKQSAQPNKRKSPRASKIETKRAAFLEALRESGNISWALEKSKLSRRTAYDHLNKDGDFAEDWMAALEVASDELISEARARAVGYEIGADGKKRFREASDRLLILLLKRNEFSRKWKHRLFQTAHVSQDVISIEGRKAGLTDGQIAQLLQALSDGYSKIPMI